MTAPAVDPRAVLAEDLRTTASYLLRRGWIAGDFETPEGVCLTTAIGHALPRDRADIVGRAVDQFLHAEVGLTILAWNDQVCDSGDQAASLLLYLASHLDGRQAVNGHA